MGIPYVEAPSEAEAQCAALAEAGKVNKFIERKKKSHLVEYF